MQILNVTSLPIYLPYDKAPVPFGDPLQATSEASGHTISAPGYVPTNGDAVACGPGTIPSGLTAGTRYYVVSANASTGTFKVSATKGGSAIVTGASAGFTIHLLSGETDGVTIPFKTGYTVVVLNLTGGSLVLQGAADTGTGYGNPQGPGTPVTLATVGAGSAASVVLAYDWIFVSTAATLVLMQN